jgi:hypothetical protein
MACVCRKECGVSHVHRFRKDRHVRVELVSRALEEKSLSVSVKGMVNDREDLQEIWDTLNTCFDRPEKYILEALDPVVKFKKYRAFDSGAVREFYSLFRSAMLGARKAGLLHRKKGAGSSRITSCACFVCSTM